MTNSSGETARSTFGPGLPEEATSRPIVDEALMTLPFCLDRVGLPDGRQLGLVTKESLRRVLGADAQQSGQPIGSSRIFAGHIFTGLDLHLRGHHPDALDQTMCGCLLRGHYAKDPKSENGRRLLGIEPHGFSDIAEHINARRLNLGGVGFGKTASSLLRFVEVLESQLHDPEQT
ncbi:MAG TPA: hypothetical protein VLG37_04830 [Candidatus Saccharimonadales bacterium]|nr:hypothetical protein [Candidatus Saccharimonadales bacterium]